MENYLQTLVHGVEFDTTSQMFKVTLLDGSVIHYTAELMHEIVTA